MLICVNFLKYCFKDLKLITYVRMLAPKSFYQTPTIHTVATVCANLRISSFWNQPVAKSLTEEAVCGGVMVHSRWLGNVLRAADSRCEWRKGNQCDRPFSLPIRKGSSFFRLNLQACTCPIHTEDVCKLSWTHYESAARSNFYRKQAEQTEKVLVMVIWDDCLTVLTLCPPELHRRLCLSALGAEKSLILFTLTN